MFYLLKNIYRTDKLYLAFIVLIVPVQIGIIALEAYVPKAVIDVYKRQTFYSL